MAYTTQYFIEDQGKRKEKDPKQYSMQLDKQVSKQKIRRLGGQLLHLIESGEAQATQASCDVGAAEALRARMATSGAGGFKQRAVCYSTTSSNLYGRSTLRRTVAMCNERRPGSRSSSSTARKRAVLAVPIVYVFSERSPESANPLRSNSPFTEETPQILFLVLFAG
jgi:hypothetical protein